jgi:hypothetical protein
MAGDADLVAQIIREVGDPNGSVAPLAATLFAAFADRRLRHPELGPRLQSHYTKRALLDLRLAEEQPSTDINVAQDIRDRQAQRFEHLVQMRADCQAEIERMEAIINANRAPKLAALTATEPIPPPYPGTPDANSPLYQGSPYARRLTW